MVMAMYIVILYFTQSFSFGAYQIRIATALYALAYQFPFLVLPLVSPILYRICSSADSALWTWRAVCIVGILAAACIVLIRRKNWSRVLIAVPIILVPGLGVATYLSYFLSMPYPLMAVNLCIGQMIPSIVGVILVKALEKGIYPGRTAGITGENEAQSTDNPAGEHSPAGKTMNGYEFKERRKMSGRTEKELEGSIPPWK